MLCCVDKRMVARPYKGLHYIALRLVALHFTADVCEIGKHNNEMDFFFPLVRTFLILPAFLNFLLLTATDDF